MFVLPDLQNIILFAFNALLLIIIPGPAFIYIINRSLSQGLRAGLLSILGIEIGSFIHVIAVAFGLSTLLNTYPTLFSLIKYLGVAYLIFLGIQKIRAKIHETDENNSANTETGFKIFKQGIIVNILNPKIALFFMAFLPQFVNIGKGGLSSQILFLGLEFNLIALFVGLLLVILADKLRTVFNRKNVSGKNSNLISGLVYILLGLFTLSN